MTKVCTHAGLRSKEKRLFSPPRALVTAEPFGDADRSGEEEGLRAGAGSLEFDLERRTPRPPSSAYGEIDDLRWPFFARASCSFSSSSCSTSRISSPTPSLALMARPSLISLKPKTRNKAAAAKWVKRSDTRDGTACPRKAERTVITIRAEKAAEKTSSRGCRIAINAATRNVLSPISENIIIVKDSMNE
jgi:hypothetical protein